MSDLVLHNWLYLAPLTKHHTHPLFQEILSQLSPNQIKALCEIAVNTYYGVIPITSLYKNKLSIYKEVFDSLSQKKSLAKKRTELLDHPEFITLLLKAVQKHITTVLFN